MEAEKNQWATSAQTGAPSGQIVSICCYLHNFQRPQWIQTPSPIMGKAFAIDFFSSCVPALMWLWAELDSSPLPESRKPCFSLFGPLCQEELCVFGEFLSQRSNEQAPATHYLRALGGTWTRPTASLRGMEKEHQIVQRLQKFARSWIKVMKKIWERPLFVKTGADWTHFYVKRGWK